MSFSSDAKAELCRVPLTRRCCARAEAYGVLLYAGIFSPTEVRIVTESEDFAARLPKLFQKAFGVRFDAQESGSKSIFRITDGQKLAVILEALGYDPDQHYALHVNFALLEEECCRASFLRGAFLAGIEELLTRIGAPAAAMEVMAAKVEKEMRNTVNRRVNCDAANVDKAVAASREQVEALTRLTDAGIVATLPVKLQEVAVARLLQPELSLSELAETFDPPLTKSCLNHRMRKLMELAGKEKA